MGRAAYAFRDLDEELHAFADGDGDYVHVYRPHHSPPDAKSKNPMSTKNLNGLSESTMLQMYVDHRRVQRRRKLLGIALFVSVALLAVLPVLLTTSSSNSESALDLAISAPYRAMRTRAEPRANAMEQNMADAESEDEWQNQNAEVGQPDAHDLEKPEDTETIVHEIVDGTIITMADEDDEDEEQRQDAASPDSDNGRGPQTHTVPKPIRIVTDDEEDDGDGAR